MFNVTSGGHSVYRRSTARDSTIQLTSYRPASVWAVREVADSLYLINVLLSYINVFSALVLSAFPLSTTALLNKDQVPTLSVCVHARMYLPSPLLL
jgi:hypothetical protein